MASSGRTGPAATGGRDTAVIHVLFRSRTVEFARRREELRKARITNSFHDGDVDNVPLMPFDESGNTSTSELRQSLPPEWVDDVEEVHELMKTIKEKMKELTELHNKHVNQVKFDNQMKEEHAIEILTSEITSIFHKAEKKLGVIGLKGKNVDSKQHFRVTKNVLQSLATSLQDLSVQFRGNQSTYLKKLKGREERARGFAAETVIDETDEAAAEAFDTGFNAEQQGQLQDNTQMIKRREEEITNIVNSISELHTIFKDLSILIVDQGSILDRIDYNIEMASHHIEEGRKQLVLGEKYQKSAAKKYIIVLLILIVLAFVFAIIFAKKHK
eukprot:m.137866 g.137866  ORF g.137866 m.137866 type:complete len:329 (-) comp16613_c0_seq4:330-1316(-)